MKEYLFKYIQSECIEDDKKNLYFAEYPIEYIFKIDTAADL